MALTKPVFILSSATTQFGELWDQSLTSLSHQAYSKAFKQTDVKHDQIDLLIVSNFLSSQIEGRSHLSSLIAQDLNLDCPNFAVEAACASGGLAVRQALAALHSTQAKTVLVIGVEKMTDVDTGLISQYLTAAAGKDEALSGITFPGLYALITQSYLNSHKLTIDSLAPIAVQAHNHAKLNPDAQFQRTLTPEQVNSSPLVADPLRQLHCAPISDGASALILSLTPTSQHQPAITASVQSADILSLANRPSLSTLGSVTKLAQLLNLSSVIDDIQLAEIHDCFSITHALILESLGLCSPGQAPQMIANGFGSLNSSGMVINPSGGLKACGHPIGATGVKQIHELALQVAGKALKRQVKNAHQGLAINLGGTGATAIGHLVERIKT